MQTRIVMTMALLVLAASVYGQDSSSQEDRPARVVLREAKPYGENVSDAGGYGDVVVSGEYVAEFLVIESTLRPQHPILKGMGLRLRQINDWLVYEHFDLANQTGMVAEEILTNLPAYKAGIRWHDVIAKVDGKAVSSVDDLVKAYNACQGDEVPVQIIQKGRLKTVKISKRDVAKWEKDFRIGVHVQPVPKELSLHLGWDANAQPALYISGVVAGSPAEKAGLKEGDLLLKADQTPLKSSDVLNNLVRESQGREISLEYLRAGKTREIKLAAAEQPIRPAMGEMMMGYGDMSAFSELLTKIPQDPLSEQATLQNLVQAVEQLSKDVAELRNELKEKE